MNRSQRNNGSALAGANPVQALSRFISRYFSFSGRASRSEFWWWLLSFVVVSIALGILNKAIAGPPPTTGDPVTILQYSMRTSVLQLIWAALNFVGAASLTVRRLHDVGLSGWWWFIQLVPLLGSMTMVIMVAMPGTPSGPRFGVDSPAKA